MSAVLKAQKHNALKAEAKGKGKRKAEDMEVDEAEVPQTKRIRNKQRVLLLSSRGITHRMRHFMNDLEVLLPHTKKGTRYHAIKATGAHGSHRFQAGLQKSSAPAS